MNEAMYDPDDECSSNERACNDKTEEIITTLDDDQRHLHISAPSDDWNER